MRLVVGVEELVVDGIDLVAAEDALARCGAEGSPDLGTLPPTMLRQLGPVTTSSEGSMDGEEHSRTGKDGGSPRPLRIDFAA